jgi:hypothetical protein
MATFSIMRPLESFMKPPVHSRENRREERLSALSRRRFLRGLGGAGLALPAFPSLLPRVARAADEERAPLRMGFFMVPNGVVQSHWWPTGGERDFVLGQGMTDLEPYRQHIQIISGLDHENATPGPDGAGDHARAGATYLTGMRARKTAGKDIHVGVSIDQLAAQKVGHLTRYPSLELSCDEIRNSGSCDSGYACAYQYNLSWSSPTTPVTPEANPKLAFERLFGVGDHGERKDSLARSRETQKSVLDFILEDAQSIEKQLGVHDRRKLDEYLSGIRSVERRIQDVDAIERIPDPNIPTPEGAPEEMGARWDIMYEIMRLAFLSDQTRISTLLLANDGSNHPYPQLGISEGHHWLTHNLRVQDMLEKTIVIEAYYMQHFAQFIRTLSETEDIDGRPLIDNVMLLYGAAISDGNRHTHNNLPALLVGGGAGKLRPGRYVDVGSRIPMSNLFVTMLDHMGVAVDSFGDSNGRFDHI